GHQRVIFIGPKAQLIVGTYLLRDSTARCFMPAESEKSRRLKRHTNRVTPLGCGNRPGTARKRPPKRSAGDAYTSDSYRRAIARACERAFGMSDDLRKMPQDATPGEREEIRRKAR